MQADKVVHFLGEFTGIINRARWHLFLAYDTIGNSNAVIIFTKRRRLMYDACTIFVRDVGINDDSKCSIFILRSMLTNS